MNHTPSAFKRVPFNPIWISHDKLDLKAIYRRPRWIEGKYGQMVQEVDAHGVPTWDLTAPLPVRHHNKWTARGFEYITLAKVGDLLAAGKYNALSGHPREYLNIGGEPWNAEFYLEVAVQEDRAAFLQMRDLVDRLGSQAVIDVQRMNNPHFMLPPSLMDKAPGELSRQDAIRAGIEAPDLADVKTADDDAADGAAAKPAKAKGGKAKGARK